MGADQISENREVPVGVRTETGGKWCWPIKWTQIECLLPSYFCPPVSGQGPTRSSRFWPLPLWKSTVFVPGWWKKGEHTLHLAPHADQHLSKTIPKIRRATVTVSEILNVWKWQTTPNTAKLKHSKYTHDYTVRVHTCVCVRFSRSRNK